MEAGFLELDNGALSARSNPWRLDGIMRTSRLCGVRGGRFLKTLGFAGLELERGSAGPHNLTRSPQTRERSSQRPCQELITGRCSDSLEFKRARRDARGARSTSVHGRSGSGVWHSKADYAEQNIDWTAKEKVCQDPTPHNLEVRIFRLC